MLTMTPQNIIRTTVLAFILCACTTTKQDVAKTDLEAEHVTQAAYNRADEKALKAQNEADEKSSRVATEASEKVDKIQEEAQVKADVAYTEAEKTEAAAQQNVNETRRKEFVDRIEARIAQLRKDIAAFDQSAKKDPKYDANKRIKHVKSMSQKTNAAEIELKATKSADAKTWEKTIPAVESATKNADDHVAGIKAGR